MLGGVSIVPEEEIMGSMQKVGKAAAITSVAALAAIGALVVVSTIYGLCLECGMAGGDHGYRSDPRSGDPR